MSDDAIEPESTAAGTRHRRWPWLVGAVVLVPAGIAALVWFVLLPEYRPSLHDDERYGVDVSSHQGEIDWPRVAGDDIEFVYIKATEGGDFTDPRFASNWEGAAAAGLDRGAYHFFSLCTSGGAQAVHFLAVVPDEPGALPPAVDLELAGNCSHRPSNNAVQREVRAFLDAVQSATGEQVVLYVGNDFEGRYPVRRTRDRPLWHPRFLHRPDMDGWVVWQVMGFAHIEGMDGRVDLDVMSPTLND